ncbi:hypothetical protein A4R44_06272 [Amycolatopsis sp. M39]|uniref:Uncharacterized protein n=1 Tax=Amycolatopsis rubida TaxID=112413 RepID=A0A1I5SDF4_9PSEU|nr:hypothetical protein A4R44_06272 [Amycolatopsis sp. M39]SFP68749.1 hypothetical protein SAMN05421854_106286 [Amycolatopsis rubida]
MNAGSGNVKRAGELLKLSRAAHRVATLPSANAMTRS